MSATPPASAPGSGAVPLPPPAPAPAPAAAAAPASKTQATSDNPYRRFVEEQEDSIDLIGHVAYSLFKRDKLALIDWYHATVGRAPTDDELNAFIAGSLLDDRLASYNSTAQEILRIFSEQALERAKLDVHARYEKKLVQELKAARPFFKNLFDNILATIGALIVMTVIVFVFYASRVSAVSAIAAYLGYEVKERPGPDEVSKKSLAPIDQAASAASPADVLASQPKAPRTK